MAIIDHLLEFTKSTGQALSAKAASDFRIDFGQEAPTTGMDNQPLYAVFYALTAIGGTLTVSLQDCDTEGGSYADVAASATLTAPAAGTQIVIPMPRHHKRFVQAHFGGAPSSGTIRGFITTGLQDNVPPAEAPSVAAVK